MRTALICVFVLFIKWNSQAQSHQVDSIYRYYKQKLKYQKNDTNKVLFLQDFAYALSIANQTGAPNWNDTVWAYREKAKQLSIKLKFQQGIELAYYFEGYKAELEGDYTKAIVYYRASSKIAESRKAFKDLFFEGQPEVFLIFNACLNIYYYQADYPKAMEIAEKGLVIAEGLADQETSAHYINQIGFIYLKQEKSDQSVIYFRQYVSLAKSLNNKMMIADASDGLADCYLLKNDFKTCLSYLFSALSHYEAIKVKPGGDYSEKLDKTRSVNKFERIAYTLFKISICYKKSGDLKKALEFSKKLFAILNEWHGKSNGSSNYYDLAAYYVNAGDIYSTLGNYSAAGEYLEKGLSIAKAIKHGEDTRDAYEALSKNFAAQKNFILAFQYHLLFTELKDSIINENVAREINTLGLAQRDKEIALLNQQQKLKLIETDRQELFRNFMIGLIAFIAFFIIIIINIKSRNKQQKLVLEKQLAVQTERQRISSDMHDDIGTSLSTLLIYTNLLKIKLINRSEYHEIEKIVDLGNELVEHLNEIVWSLNPGNDSLESLLIYIRQYFNQLFETLPYQTNLVFPETIADGHLKGSTRRNTYLVVKEALNNVIKHAGATRVMLIIELVGKSLIITVKDNGNGFPEGSELKFFSNGLKNMKRRMEQIGGRFSHTNENGAVIKLEIDIARYPNE